ncbi:Oligopeptide-binding oppA-like protein, partial [Daphnia magna]
RTPRPDGHEQPPPALRRQAVPQGADARHRPQLHQGPDLLRPGQGADRPDRQFDAQLRPQSRDLSIRPGKGQGAAGRDGPEAQGRRHAGRHQDPGPALWRPLDPAGGIPARILPPRRRAGDGGEHRSRQLDPALHQLGLRHRLHVLLPVCRSGAGRGADLSLLQRPQGLPRQRQRLLQPARRRPVHRRHGRDRRDQE